MSRRKAGPSADGSIRPDSSAVLDRVLGRFRLPRTPDQADRHATWLELFFDLVFVLAVSAVTARLDAGEEGIYLPLGYLIVRGAPAHSSLRALAAPGLALIVPVGIWWVYTAFLNSRLAVPRLASGQAYAYLHLPVGAGIILSGWALGRAAHTTAVHRGDLPLTVRLILAASIATWIFGVLGRQSFTRGGLSRRKLVTAVLSIVPIAAVAGFVGEPIPLLALTAAIVACYATVTTTYIARARAALTR